MSEEDLQNINGLIIGYRELEKEDVIRTFCCAARRILGLSFILKVMLTGDNIVTYILLLCCFALCVIPSERESRIIMYMTGFLQNASEWEKIENDWKQSAEGATYIKRMGRIKNAIWTVADIVILILGFSISYKFICTEIEDGWKSMVGWAGLILTVVYVIAAIAEPVAEKRGFLKKKE